MKRYAQGCPHQQRATVVQLSDQDAAVGEEVGRVYGVKQVPHAGLQTDVQLAVHVELPRVRWLLHLRGQQRKNKQKLVTI